MVCLFVYASLYDDIGSLHSFCWLFYLIDRFCFVFVVVVFGKGFVSSTFVSERILMTCSSDPHFVCRAVETRMDHFSREEGCFLVGIQISAVNTVQTYTSTFRQTPIPRCPAILISETVHNCHLKPSITTTAKQAVYTSRL